MKIRYRKPSLKTLLGVTNAKKQVKRQLGIYEVTRVLNAPAKRAVGWESEPAKFLRFLTRLFK